MTERIALVKEAARFAAEHDGALPVGAKTSNPNSWAAVSEALKKSTPSLSNTGLTGEKVQGQYQSLGELFKKEFTKKATAATNALPGILTKYIKSDEWTHREVRHFFFQS